MTFIGREPWSYLEGRKLIYRLWLLYRSRERSSVCMPTASASIPASRSVSCSKIVTARASASTKVSVVTSVWPKSYSATSCPSLSSTASPIGFPLVQLIIYITPRHTGIYSSSRGSAASLIVSSAIASVVCTTPNPSIKSSAIFWTIISTRMIGWHYLWRR